MSTSTARRQYVCLTILSAVLITQCGAILNANDDRMAICDTDICKCTSWGQITVTCSCNATSAQQIPVLELTGDYKPHVNTNIFRIENCQRVHIASNTFADLQHLRHIELSNIGQLIIEENGFSWKVIESLTQETYPQSGITITINNSSIPKIPSHAFKGRLESVIVNKASIETVAPFAFVNLYGMETLQFIDTNFTNLEPQAFKKFAVDTFTLSGGNYGSVPSRTMVDLQVKTLLIENISADLLRSSAFNIYGPESFNMKNCRFIRLEGDAFRIVTRGPIHIQNNVFISLAGGAFAGITVEKNTYTEQKQQKLVFTGNNLTHFEAGALVFNTSRLIPELDRILIEQPCACNAIELWSVQLQIHPSSSLRQKLDNDKTSKALEVLWCRWEELGKANNRYISFHEYSKSSCGVMKFSVHNLLIVIISSSALLLLIGVVMIIVCRRRRSRNQRWTNVSTNEDKKDNRKTGKTKRGGPDSRINMVVPDGRMYRETELHVIVEQAEPISDQHIYQNVKPMLQTSLRQKPVPLPRTSLT